MRLRLRDAAYTERLAAFLRSVGQQPSVSAPDTHDTHVHPVDLDVYLRVWQVLHPDAEVTVQA